jgi:shikimate 5-dehydrogenase
MIKKEAVKGIPESGDNADDNYKAQAQPFDSIAVSLSYSPQSTPVTREKAPAEGTLLNGMNVLPLQAVKYRSRPSQDLESGHTHTKKKRQPPT